jgi:hypothetical protein
LYSLEDWRNHILTLDTVHENAKLVGLDPYCDKIIQIQNSTHFIETIQILEINYQSNFNENLEKVEFAVNK